VTESWASAEVDEAKLGISGYVLFRKDRSTLWRGEEVEFCCM
jgi:hypothetical protein